LFDDHARLFIHNEFQLLCDMDMYFKLVQGADGYIEETTEIGLGIPACPLGHLLGTETAARLIWLLSP